MQHQLLKCCMTVCAKHNASGNLFGKGFGNFGNVVFFIVLLFLSVPQTNAVGPVLGVDKQLHLELGSYHGLRCGLLVLFYGFKFCLEKNITVIIFQDLVTI